MSNIIPVIISTFYVVPIYFFNSVDNKFWMLVVKNFYEICYLETYSFRKSKRFSISFSKKKIYLAPVKEPAEKIGLMTLCLRSLNF